MASNSLCQLEKTLWNDCAQVKLQFYLTTTPQKQENILQEEVIQMMLTLLWNYSLLKNGKHTILYR